MQKKALIILCVLVLTSSGYAAPPAHAAIPVIDVDNITQQLKTYQETVKVVTNTKEQVELQWRELKKLPSQILNGYKTSLINGWNKIQDILTKNGTVIYGTTGTISDKGVPDLATAHTIYINDYFNKNIPAIIGNDLPETLGSARTARLITLATLMRNNADTLAAMRIPWLLFRSLWVNWTVSMKKSSRPRKTAPMQKELCRLSRRRIILLLCSCGHRTSKSSFRAYRDSSRH